MFALLVTDLFLTELKAWLIECCIGYSDKSEEEKESLIATFTDSALYTVGFVATELQEATPQQPMLILELSDDMVEEDSFVFVLRSEHFTVEINNPFTTDLKIDQHTAELQGDDDVETIDDTEV